MQLVSGPLDPCDPEADCKALKAHNLALYCACIGPKVCTMSQKTRYMNRDELAKLMKSDKASNTDFIVVDVRDEDFAGGNIRGAINQPSREFLMNVDHLVKKTKHVPVVIFHCALSQVRGPKAARIYGETRKNILDGNDIDHEVVILRDGFTGFQEKYKHDPELIENWDKNEWEPDWTEGPDV